MLHQLDLITLGDVAENMHAVDDSGFTQATLELLEISGMPVVAGISSTYQMRINTAVEHREGLERASVVLVHPELVGNQEVRPVDRILFPYSGYFLEPLGTR